MLPSMLTSQTEQITQLMVQYREEIKTKPKNVREFIRFDENVKIIDGQLDDLSASISGISFLSAIIKGKQERNRGARGELKVEGEQGGGGTETADRSPQHHPPG
jgi:transcription antitermination factor NusG